MKEEDNNSLKQRIVELFHERIQSYDEELELCLDKTIMEMSRKCYFPLSRRLEMRCELLDQFCGLGILQKFIDDPHVTEIMVNGTDHIFIERNGWIELCNQIFESEEQLEDLIQQMVGRVNRRVNRSNPVADARLEDGSRVHIVLPPVALNGPVVTIRKFPVPITMEQLVKANSISREAANFMEAVVNSGYNILISGGTNSGKSTFLNALTSFIPKNERVITIEDSAELQIGHVANLVRMETRNANLEGEGELTVGDLIRATLRMNPSRIIVGEIRGKEASDLIFGAFNTGHKGSISTGHANSAKDMLARLETMILMGMEIPLTAIRSQIISAVDLVVHLGRLDDQIRRVLAIEEVDGYCDGEIKLNPLYQYKQVQKDDTKKKGGNLEKVGELHSKKKLWESGYDIS